MYNLHRGRGGLEPQQPRQGRRRLSAEEEAKIKEQALFAQNLLTAFFEFKQLEKNMSNHCLGKCLNFEEKYLEDREKECLKNCVGKITPFMKTAKNIFKENDQKFSDFEDKYLKSEAFFHPDKFMKTESLK